MNKYQEALDSIVNELIECGRAQDLKGETILNEQIELNLLRELVDNPPLKFEELKEGMWVWDNSVYEKNYSQVKKVFRLGTDFVVSMEKDECEDGDEYLGRAFEGNRFFRREVTDEKIQ